MPLDLNQIENRLWAAANQLWANTGLKPSEFSNPVLGLIFLRYAEKRSQEVEAKFTERGLDPTDIEKFDYQAEGALYLPENAHFSYLVELAEDQDLGKAVNEAMATVERENEELKGVLPRSYGRLPNAVLVELLRLLNGLGEIEGDAFGKIYEYFLGKFALAEGQKGGVFYTPTSIVKLIVEIIEPFHGKIYDPACGSGGMFVQSAEFVTRHKKRAAEELTVFGTEKASDTVKLAKMNLAVHGLSGDIRESNTYYEDPHKATGKFDFVMANPPFNVSGVDKERVKDDPRFPFGMPASDNANYLWIQHFFSSLNERGRAGFVMHNSAADSEMEIRKNLIEGGWIDAVVITSPNLFYTVSLPCTLWFMDKGKPESNRADKVLFIDARKVYRQVDSVIREITAEQIDRIALAVKSHRGEQDSPAYQDIPGFCKRVATSEIRKRGYSLNPKLYVDHLGQEANQELKEELIETANDRIVRAKEIKQRVAAAFGKDILLDRDMLLYFAAVSNAGRFQDWISGPTLRDLLASYIGGTWGQEAPDEVHTEIVRVIRGTDMPSVIRGELSSCPIRFVKPSQLKSRRLAAGDIVIEVSGGGKEVTTGRTVIVTQALLNGSQEPLVCASFCKMLRVAEDKIDPWTLYLFLQHIYAHGVMGKYEVQSTGIKNFQTEIFLDEIRVGVKPPETDAAHVRDLFELAHEIGLSIEPIRQVAIAGGCDPALLDFDSL